jgi:hypothetical protein
MTARRRLPDRRLSENFDFELGGQRYHATVMGTDSATRRRQAAPCADHRESAAEASILNLNVGQVLRHKGAGRAL